MAGKYDSTANGGDESVRLLAARLAQSSLTQETATLHVLPSTTSPGEPASAAGCSREPCVGAGGCGGAAEFERRLAARPRAQ